MTVSPPQSHGLETTGILLDRWKDGDGAARDRLIGRLYPELERIAAARLRAERDSSLSTGDLINDVVLKLMKVEQIDLADRNHFIALSSRIMRHILVDHARSQRAAKNRHLRVELTTRIDGPIRFDLAALDAALMRLSAVDEDLTRLVEMRYFGGMTVADVTSVTGVPEASVKRRWQTARAWLADALANPIDNG